VAVPRQRPPAPGSARRVRPVQIVKLPFKPVASRTMLTGRLGATRRMVMPSRPARRCVPIRTASPAASHDGTCDRSRISRSVQRWSTSIRRSRRAGAAAKSRSSHRLTMMWPPGGTDRGQPRIRKSRGGYQTPAGRLSIAGSGFFHGHVRAELSVNAGRAVVAARQERGIIGTRTAVAGDQTLTDDARLYKVR